VYVLHADRPDVCPLALMTAAPEVVAGILVTIVIVAGIVLVLRAIFSNPGPPEDDEEMAGLIAGNWDPFRR
jgi:hypothetical protein